MALRYAQLMSTDHDQMISRYTDYDAWYCLEHGLLLALLESGTLSNMQFHQPSSALRPLFQQRLLRQPKLHV